MLKLDGQMRCCLSILKLMSKNSNTSSKKLMTGQHNMKQELYVYSTEIYLRANKLKVGQCRVDRHEERIKEQFGTSNPESPKILWVKELPDRISDKDIHHQLIKNGCRRIEKGAGTEWFKATVNDVKRAYHELVNGVSREEDYSLRQEQCDAINKAVKWFRGEYPHEVLDATTHQRFLINAKMRFGKCFTSMHIAKRLNAFNTLIVTYKPDVIGEWLDTVNKHVDFADQQALRAKRKKDRRHDPCLTDAGEFPSMTASRRVVCVSLQDLSIDADGQTKKRLQKIPAIEWDMVIFDEVHYGSRTERARHILGKLDYQHRLDLSGTPFKLIAQDDYCHQQVFTYSYLDEQKRKKDEASNNSSKKVYRQMPDLNIQAIEITDEDLQEQREKFATDDIDFSLNRLFETKDGKFIYEDAVDHFLAGLWQSGHEARSLSVFGKLAQRLKCPAKRHTVWWLNRVDAVKLLIEKLQRHPYFCKFILIDASGSDNKKADNDRLVARDKNKVIKAIKQTDQEPDKLGTITFTCGRFLTGVTIEAWDSILILNDTTSAEAYFQAIFRVQSAYTKEEEILKPTAWVFDFAITRCLRVVYKCAENIVEQIDQQESYEQKLDASKDNLQITTQALCDDLCITRFYEGRLTGDKTTAAEIFAALHHEGSKIALARKITANTLVNFASLKQLEQHPELFDILKRIKGYRTQEVAELDAENLVQIGRDADDLEELKLDPNTADEEKEEMIEDSIKKDKDKGRKKLKEWYATQIKRLAICMADFIYMTYEREYKIDHVIQTKSPHFFLVMTGITKDDFTKLCDLGFMNRAALDKIVSEFRHQEETSLSPEKFIRENLTELAG